MKAIIGTLLIIPLLLWGGLRIYKAIVYDIECGGHLKRAADANTVEIAHKELATVLVYLELNRMVEGYTSVLWKTPDEDVAFWYNNLKSAQTELEKVDDETTQLERTNVLMKLRETILDQGAEGQSVTEPSGISVFPNNGVWMLFGGISTLLMCVGIGLILWHIEF